MFQLKSLLTSSHVTFWPLQVLGWVGFFALNYLGAIGYGKSWDYVSVSLACAIIGFLITCLLRLGYRALWHLPAWRMGWGAVLLLLVATISYVICYTIYCSDCRQESMLGYIGYVGSMMYVLLSWSGLYFGIKFNRQLQQQKLAALQALAMAHEAQLKMLRYQLNPHFLFNTLNAISTLILDAKQDTANRMVSSLSAFLRYSLDSDPVQRVSLAQEIEALNLYLGIEQLRFGDRLQVIMDIAPEARDALVPSLILQPLIENAMKYAIAKREQGGSVELQARREGDSLDLRLRDDGPGSDDFPDKQLPCRGVGLANTRERLRVLYGERQSFSIANRQPHGVEVHLRLPFDAAPAGT